jgi:hypothetical protein
MARWHVNARTNGGLAGSYGRARLLQAVLDAWLAGGTGAGGVHWRASPSRLEAALRWVHSDSALVEGRLVGASAVLLDVAPAPRGVAMYVLLHREAVKARRVRGGWGVRAVAGWAAPL